MFKHLEAKKKFLLIVLGTFVLVFAPYLISQVKAIPSTPGTGSGIIQYDSTTKNLSFGTSTVTFGASNISPNFPFRILSPTSSAFFIVQPDGRISIATTTPPSIGDTSSSANGNFELYIDGGLKVKSIDAYNVNAVNFTGGGIITGSLNAGYVTPGIFNNNCGSAPCGGDYAFPGKLGVNTSTNGGLPATLSVFGGGYFSGNVSVGTSTASAYPLHVVGTGVVGGGAIYGEAGTKYIGVMALGNVSGWDFYGNGPKSYFSGNVGIGSGATSPAYQLQVNGTFRAATSTFTGQINTDASGIRFSDGTVQTSTASLTANSINGGTANYLARWATANTLTSSTIFQDANSNIGIGIAPGTSGGNPPKLEVYDISVLDPITSAQIKVSSIATGTYQNMSIGRTPSYGFIQSGQNKPLVLNPVANNVGIGTINPGSKLTVSGDDVYISSSFQGIILKAPNGTSCFRVTITNSGNFSTSSLACPSS